MGLFEAIRSRSGLVIGVIGISLVAFVLTDFLTSGNMLFQGDRDVVGRINGEKISYLEFNKEVEELRQNPQYGQATPLQLSELVWNNLLNEKLLVLPMSELGFTVTTEELTKVIEMTPSVQQMPGLQDPNTGQFRPDLLRSALQNLRDQRESSPEAAAQWASWVAYEQDVKNQALSSKIYDAVAAGMRMPQSLQLAQNTRNNRQLQLKIAAMTVSEIKDGEATPTDEDYQAIYDEYKPNFKVNVPVRDAMVADFPLVPSDQDLAKAKEELVKIAADFATSVDDSAFAAANTDVFVPIALRPEANINPNVLPYVQGKGSGFVSEPIQDGDVFRVVKVMGRASLPDSARAKHILIAYAGSERSQATRSYQEAKSLADSLLKQLKGGASFPELSKQYSSDVVAASKDGDLGWFKPGQMTPAFESFCFEKNTGTMDLVETEFGFHLVQVTGQKGARPALRLAEVVRRVTVSPESEQKVYAKAGELAKLLQEGMKAEDAAKKVGAQLIPARNVRATDASVMGMAENREVVRWIFNEEREVGDVSVVNNNYKSYAVVQLTAVFEDGYKPLESVKEDLTPLATNRAKVRVLAERLAAKKTVEWTDASVTLAAPYLPTGREAKVVGLAAGAKVGFTSGVIEGSNGAYRFKLVNAFDAPNTMTPADVAAENNRLAGSVQQMLLQSLLQSAKVQDNRGTFY
jgi:peptidyl-prolyl cis-trans isomerase D